MKTLISSALLLLFTIASCTSAPPAGPSPSDLAKEQARARLDGALAGPAPSWVNEPGNNPQFPLSRYMIAVGQTIVEDGNQALAGEKAVDNGRKQISEQLNSEVQGVTEIYMREVGINKEFATTTEYVEEVRNKTASLLYGSKEGARHYDPAANALYVLVVLEREAHARTLLSNVDSALAQTNSATEQTSAAGKLQALIEEHVALEKVMPSLLTLNIVVPKSLSIRADVDQRFETAKTRMKTIFKEYRDANVSLNVVSGDGQQGFADSELPKPVVFEAFFMGKPLVGFPVAFALEHPSRGEISEASFQTGPDGRLSCKVVGLKLTGDEENEVIATLDFRSLGESVFKAPLATTTYKMPTLGTSTFSILIDETNLDQTLPESAVAGRIKAALGQREVRVVALNSFLSNSELKEAATMSPASLRKKLGGKVDYLIRGNARSRFSSKMGAVSFCYAGGSLQLLDIRTGQQLATLEVPLSSAGVKKPGGSKEDAGTSALKAFAQLAEKKFMAEIDATFKAM